jgi:hypothetical protein
MALEGLPRTEGYEMKNTRPSVRLRLRFVNEKPDYVRD